jgi:hypothetical protein
VLGYNAKKYTHSTAIESDAQATWLYSIAMMGQVLPIVTLQEFNSEISFLK